jgi:hypothetical protein
MYRWWVQRRGTVKRLTLVTEAGVWTQGGRAARLFRGCLRACILRSMGVTMHQQAGKLLFMIGFWRHKASAAWGSCLSRSARLDGGVPGAGPAGRWAGGADRQGRA